MFTDYTVWLWFFVTLLFGTMFLRLVDAMPVRTPKKQLISQAIAEVESRQQKAERWRESAPKGIGSEGIIVEYDLPRSYLHHASRGEEVKTWQIAIRCPKIDMIFGPETELYTEIWQENNGLAPTGIVGPVEWAMCEVMLATGTNPALVYSIQSAIAREERKKLEEKYPGVPVRDMSGGMGVEQIIDYSTGEVVATYYDHEPKVTMAKCDCIDCLNMRHNQMYNALKRERRYC